MTAYSNWKDFKNVNIWHKSSDYDTSFIKSIRRFQLQAKEYFPETK